MKQGGREGDEVIQDTDLVVDGALGQAGGEGAQRDAAAALGGEASGCGVQGVRAALAIALGWVGATSGGRQPVLTAVFAIALRNCD